MKSIIVFKWNNCSLIFWDGTNVRRFLVLFKIIKFGITRSEFSLSLSSWCSILIGDSNEKFLVLMVHFPCFCMDFNSVGPLTGMGIGKVSVETYTWRFLLKRFNIGLFLLFIMRGERVREVIDLLLICSKENNLSGGKLCCRFLFIRKLIIAFKNKCGSSGTG